MQYNHWMVQDTWLLLTNQSVYFKCIYAYKLIVYDICFERTITCVFVNYQKYVIS